MSSEEDEENELAVVIGVCSGTGSAFAEGPAKHVIAVAMTVMRFLICFVINALHLAVDPPEAKSFFKRFSCF